MSEVLQGSSELSQVRYYCWDCKRDVDVSPHVTDEGELCCNRCGCTFIEVSTLATEDPDSPEKFGNTVTSATNTPVASPILAPIANDPGETIASNSTPLSAAPGSLSGSGNQDDISHSLEATIQNLFQMLFATRNEVGDGGAPDNATHGLPNVGTLGTLGDYAFGNLQEIIDTLSMNDPTAPRIGPASKALISSLPRVKLAREKYTADKMSPCAICQEDLVESNLTEATVISLGCSHCFHEKCATMWLKQSRTCPVCRFEVCQSPSAKHAAAVTMETSSAAEEQPQTQRVQNAENEEDR